MNWTESITDDVANGLVKEQDPAMFVAKLALGTVAAFGTSVAETAVNLLVKTPLVLMKNLFNNIV